MTHFLRYLLLVFLSVFCIETFAQSDNSIREVYKVKKKDTVEGICQMYGITIVDLVDANPQMLNKKFRLKKNITLNIPYPKQVEVKEVAEPVRVMKTYPGQNLKVGVMLPFSSKTDGKRMVEYYRGFLMGCDSLRSAGQNIDIQTWDLTDDMDLANVLQADDAQNCDIIFAQPDKYREGTLSQFCQNNKVKLVIPFNVKDTVVTASPYTYQIYEPQDMQIMQAIQQYVNILSEAQPIFITCDGENARKQAFFDGLKSTCTDNDIKFRTCNLGCADNIFATLFADDKVNAILLSNINGEQTFKTLFAKLEAVKALKPNVQIAVYGYVDFLIYEKSFRARYHKFNTFVPSVFYYNNSQSHVNDFENNYKEWFNSTLMTSYLPRLGFTGYDHAQFFLRGLNKLGSDFDGLNGQIEYDPLQTPLRFVSTENGIKQNNAFQVVHYDTDNSIEILVSE